MIPVLTPSTNASTLHHPHSSKDFQPSTNKYYQQLSFDGNMTLKRYVCFLGLLMFIFEIAQTLFFLPKEVLYSKTRTTISSLVLFSISLSCYYLSIFRLFRRNTPKIFRIRRVLLVFSIIAFSSAQSIKLYDEMADRVEANMVEKWYYSLLKGRNEVWTLLLADILMPTWYLKVLPYIGGWISQALVYYEFGLEHREVIWTTSVFSVLLTGLIWGFKNHHEWKLFLIKSTAEAWDDIHRYILDKVPDAIAVIDSDAKITYSNLNFKALCGDSLIDLSQKLTKIKRSEANMFTHFSAEDHHKEEEQTLHGSHREEAIFTISEVLDTIMLPLLKGSLKSEQYLTFNGKMEVSPGATRSYEIKIGPLFEYNKIILILSDTTQRDLAISLETANQYKDKLLAAVSHDLRAPINGSLRFIESSIEHEEVPCFIKEQFLIPAQRSCKFLLHLANDILDFSQINAQKLRMNFEACSLVETIKGCFQLLEMQASYKKINFQMVLDEKLPLKFATDHNRLSQVIINLLSNAIKFTFTGGVTLTAKVVGEQLEYPLVEISVVDTGIGIKDKDMHKLFQEFTRIEYEQRDLNTKGVGLGLVISNRLAKKLGPSTKKEGIAVSSVFGEGSTFRFIVEDKKIVDLKGDLARTTSLAKKDGLSSCTISLSYKEEDFLFKNIEEGDMSNARSVHNSPYQSDFSTRRHLLHSMHESSLIFQSLIYKRKQYSGKALVVDDDPVNVFALESLLKQHGVRVEAAYNGKEAIEKVIQSEEGMKGSRVRQRGKKRGSLFREEVSEGYQVIFMDYQMPVMGGIEATRRLKGMMESKEISVIPIIGCTGHQEADMVEECYLNGMVDVVRKPPEKGKLNDILERYMG